MAVYTETSNDPGFSTVSTDPLLQPFQLKHLKLRNRIVITSHEPAYSEDGMPKERYRRYHEERARGGVAMTMTAGSALVSRDSPPAFGNLLAYKDEIVPWMRQLADSCHEHGAAVMIQLTHLGRRTSWGTGDWLPTLAPSSVREVAHRAYPKKIEDWDIARIIQDYADAAERMQAAGLDGIELQAYGHLMDQFWSPAVNLRDDRYGGSLDNRLGFTYAVLDAVRERVGSEFIVGIRLVADEQLDQGLSRDEGMQICRRLVDSGQVDFLNVIRGHIDTDPGLTDVIPVQGMAASPHLDFAGEVREATRFPVMHAARINDVATARHAIASGKLDLVGMTRAHIADPHLVKKIMEKREESIRPCVGATYCLDRIYQAEEALCIHNPATGREQYLPHRIENEAVKKKHIVVVGAGPAGLEAARVAGARGHKVTVLEANSHAGGQLLLAARSRRRREMAGIVDWRLEQCEKSNVQFHFNHYAERQDVLEQNPDAVIIASGGSPEITFLEAGNGLVTSTWDILSGNATPAARVLLFDDAGNHAAMQAAEMIAVAGAELEFVTPERTLSPEIGALNLTPYIRALQPLGVTFTLCRRLVSVEQNEGQLTAVCGSDYDDTITRHQVDQVVVENATQPHEDLYFDLKPLSSNLGEVEYDALLNGGTQSRKANPDGGFQLFRIGDAVSSRNVHAAILDALRLLKDL
jgi:2,4-dienoyl-CoA reductase-like NADH-dependent reductase (Old Yellow Enzyme family)/thioredoxin reductase